MLETGTLTNRGMMLSGLSRNSRTLLVRVPVSSKARFLRYSTRLLSSLTPINSVVTSITLTKTVNKAGQPYSLFDFNAVRKLSPEEALQAQNYTHQFMELVNASHLMPEITEAS